MTENRKLPPRSTRPKRSTRRETPAVAKRKSRFDVRLVAALTLFFVGAVLLLYQPVMNHIIGPAQLEKAYANHLSADDIQANLTRHQSADATDKEAAELFDPDSIQTINALTPNPKIDKQNVIGGVYAPAVGMKLPIMFGMNQDLLLSSAGTMKREQVMGEGNYALIGHNSKNPNALFAPTHRLKAGDVVYVTDKQTVYAYEVSTHKIVKPSEIHVINDVPGESMLTLISCTDDSVSRVVVQAKLVDTVDYSDAQPDIIKAFNDL